MSLSVKKLFLSAAAVAMALAGVTPAMAGGGHGDGHGNGHGNGHYKHGDYGHGGGYGGNSYGQDWRYDGYRGSWNDGYDGHHYRYKRHHGGLSGKEAGLIAAGIVGVAILLDSAGDRGRTDDRDGRRYDDRRYDDRYDRDNRDGFYYRRDDRRGVSDRSWDNYRDNDLGLAGGRAALGEYNFGAAYNDCKAEAREAARHEGLSAGLPAKPDQIDRIEGDAVRFVARFEMQDRGRAVAQTMVCEADAGGVRFLELV